MDFMISGGYNVYCTDTSGICQIALPFKSTNVIVSFVLYIQEDPCYKKNGLGTALGEGET